jgi:hypothetical protein
LEKPAIAGGGMGCCVVQVTISGATDILHRVEGGVWRCLIIVPGY